MRFLKVFILSITALCVLLVIIYSQRLSIINTIVNAQFPSEQFKVTKINAHLTDNLTIIVEQLNLASEKANIEAADITIQWQFSLTPKITAVNVRAMQITGNSLLFTENRPLPDTSKQNDEQSLSQLLSTTLSPFIEQLTQLTFPVNIKVEQFSYLPFVSESIPENVSENNVTKNAALPYYGSINANNNHVTLLVQNSDNVAFIHAELTVTNNRFTLKLNNELQQLVHFVNIHQLPMSPALYKALHSAAFAGNVNTYIQYQNDALVIENKTTNLVVNSAKGIDKTGPFKLLGDLDFKTTIRLFQTQKTTNNNEVVTLLLSNDSSLTLNYSQESLLLLLTKNNVSDELILLLKNNPTDHLNIKLKDNTTLAVNDTQVAISDIELSVKGSQQHQIKLNNLVANLPLNAINNNYNVTVENFAINSTLHIPSLANYTTDPVSINVSGSLSNKEQTTTLHLFDNSFVKAKYIKLVNKEPLNKSLNNKLNKPVLLTIKALKAKLTGTVLLQPNSTPLLNLIINSQATQVNVPKTIQLKTFTVSSHIKGDQNNINIKATTRADNIVLANILVNGPLKAPIAEISAQKLQLTDLLSLNIKLPTEIALIDGLLDYKVSSEITDLHNLANNNVIAELAVTSLSGEIDGVWLQELNWQQNFTFDKGIISSNTEQAKNLTIALIDTPTPVNKLSSRVDFTYQNDIAISVSDLKADVLGGSIFIPTIHWPLKKGNSVNVQLTSINLEQVLALDKKQGVVVTGNISGELPISYDGQKFIIENGKLYNISNGLIQVMNNPAVSELKTSNTQLQLAFDALQNLHYHQLSSAVSIADDGYMLLETVIKGHNPDIDNDVNLNLNLSYDLPGLLESLSITKRFENNIIKNLKTH